MENIQYNAPQPPAPNVPGPMHGKAIAALVLGICAVCIPVAGIICGIIGLVFSIQVRKTNPVGSDKGFALAGMICSIVGIAVWLIYTVLVCVVACGIAMSYDYGYGYDIFNYLD